MVKKFLRSKLAISFILLILAGVLVFGFLPMNYEKQAQTTNVVQFVEDVSLGTQITESMLTTREIGLYGVDSNVITNKADIVGKYAAMDIRRTSNLYTDMFTDTWEEVDGAIDTLLDENAQLVTVSLGNGASSVGGKVKPGSIVDILTQHVPETAEVVYDEFGYPIIESGDSSTDMELVPLLEKVMVYEVLNSALENITDLQRQWVSLVKSGDDAAENFDKSLTPAYITLVVNREQALLLANQEYSGNIHLVLHPNLDSDDAQTEFDDGDVDVTLPDSQLDVESDIDGEGDAPVEPEDPTTESGDEE